MVKDMKVQSLCCTPETNLTFYVKRKLKRKMKKAAAGGRSRVGPREPAFAGTGQSATSQTAPPCPEFQRRCVGG